MFPIFFLIELLYRFYRGYQGNVPNCPDFWGFLSLSRLSVRSEWRVCQPLKGGGVKDFLLNSLQDISRVFLKDFFCLPPQAILKPSGGELGCAPNLAFLWIGLGRRCAALLNWLFQKQKYFDEKPLRTPLFFLFMEGGRPPHRPPSFYGQSCQYNYFSLWILPLGISPWPKDCQFWTGQNCHSKTIKFVKISTQKYFTFE